MLANSLYPSNILLQKGFLYLKNKLKINYMKKLQYLIVLLLLVFGTSRVFSQNISVYPTYPPRAICDGDQATLIIDPSLLPSGLTLAYYKFWVDSVNLPFGSYMGVQDITMGNPNQYTFKAPPGY